MVTIPTWDSNRDCLSLSWLVSAMISSKINNVSESANNTYNFTIYWYSLYFGSITQALPSCLVNPLAWYVVLHRSVGYIMMM